MFAKEHPGVIGGRRRLVAVDVLDSEELDEDYNINHDGAASDEDYVSGLIWADVI